MSLQQEQQQQQQQQQQKITYPVTDPKIWGGHFWHVMHQVAAAYPEYPTRNDRMRYGMFAKFLLSHLPCENPCRSNALEWNRQHPFNLSSREYFFRDTVDFHNHVNKMTGKNEQYNYKDILTASHECKNCTLSDEPTQQVPSQVGGGQNSNNEDNTQQVGQGSLKESIELYKKTINQMAEQMAKERGHPAPEIEFDQCPDGSDTSCITSDGKIFLNPRNFNLETFFHEIDHYFDLKEGKPVDDSAGTNSSATKFAREQIKRGFDLDKLKEQKQQQQDQVAQPTSSVTGVGGDPNAAVPGSTNAPEPPQPPASVLSHAKKKKNRRRRKSRDRDDDQQPQQRVQVQQAPPQQPQQPPNPYRQVVHDVYGNNPYQPPQVPQEVPFDNMPQFRAALQQIQHEETEEKLERYENSGVLSFLDPVYEYPAKMLGVDKEDLNLVQTPVILSNVSKTIMDSYLTPIASIVFSFLIGSILMVSGLLLHEKIPPRDVIFVEMLGSLFFWDMVRTLNPKKLYQLKKEFERINQQRSGGSDPFGTPQPISLKREIFETPGMYQEKEEMRDAPKALSEEELVEAGKFWMEQNKPGRKFGVLKGMPYTNETSSASYTPDYSTQSPYTMPTRRVGGAIDLRPYSIRDRYL